jgi:5-formyltetrahydrofolate cyclo-ligase
VRAEKAAAREALKARRAALAPEVRRAASLAAARHLMTSPLLEGVETVALFAAFGDEADPALVGELFEGTIVYPAVTPQGLVFRAAPRFTLTPAPPFGIPEPPATARAVEDIDLFVTPGLGFTRDGRRLGYGRGYYDRVLSAARARRPQTRAVGFAFATQLVDTLPAGPQDAPVDAVVTELGVSFTHPLPPREGD